MNLGVRGRSKCLTPSFRPALGKKEGLNWACVSLPSSCIGSFLLSMLFISIPLLEKILKKKINQFKKNVKSHLFYSRAKKLLMRHLSCSHSAMFHLIAFPPLCAPLSQQPGSDRQCWKLERKVLLF